MFLKGGSDMFKEKLLWFCGNDFMTQGFMAIQEFSHYLAELQELQFGSELLLPFRKRLNGDLFCGIAS